MFAGVDVRNGVIYVAVCVTVCSGELLDVRRRGARCGRDTVIGDDSLTCCWQYADAISFNHYPAWYDRPNDVNYTTLYWKNASEWAAEHHPTKPFLISETGTVPCCSFGARLCAALMVTD